MAYQIETENFWLHCSWCKLRYQLDPNNQLYIDEKLWIKFSTKKHKPHLLINFATPPLLKIRNRFCLCKTLLLCSFESTKLVPAAKIKLKLNVATKKVKKFQNNRISWNLFCFDSVKRLPFSDENSISCLARNLYSIEHERSQEKNFHNGNKSFQHKSTLRCEIYLQKTWKLFSQTDLVVSFTTMLTQTFFFSWETVRWTRCLYVWFLNGLTNELDSHTILLIFQFLLN